MSGLIPRVSGLGGEPPSLRAPCASGTQSRRRPSRQARKVSRSDGGSKRAAFFSQTAFFRGMSPVPLSLLCGVHPLFSLDEKRGEKNHMGRHLDTPSEIILQASLRMHFDGGQGSFLDAGQWHQETTCSLASLLFSHSGSFFFIQ